MQTIVISTSSERTVPIRWSRSAALRRGNLKMAAAAFSAVLFSAAGMCHAGVPIAKVQNNGHDFGEVWINDKVAHGFKILNAGDGELEILDAVTHCPCVQVTRLDRRIEPGKTGEVLVQLDSSAHVYGKINQRITLITNVPGDPEVELKFHGLLREYIERSPVGAGFLRVGKDETVEKEIKLANRTDKPVALELATPAQVGCFSFSLEETAAGKEWLLRVQAAPPYQPYLNEARVQIKTGVKEQPLVHVTCTAYVPPRLELRPFPLVANPAFALREVKFINNGPEPVQVRKVTCDDPRLKADVVEKKAGSEYVIRVVMPIGYTPAEPGHVITIETDDAEDPVVKLPFLAKAPSQTDAEPQP